MKYTAFSILLIVSATYGCLDDENLSSSRKEGDRNSQHTDKDNKVNEKYSKTESIEHISEKPDFDQGGLYINLTNHLIHRKPDLSLKICADSTKNEDEIEKKDQYCLALQGDLVAYNQTVGIYVPEEKLSKLMAHSDSDNRGKVSFYFNDNYSRSKSHWHCADHVYTQLDADSTDLQELQIEVTQINTFSYSCHID